MHDNELDDRLEAIVAEYMSRVAELPASVRLPDPAHVWCRSRLMHRQPDRRRVLRFLAIFDGLQVAACLAAAVALFYVSWSTLSRLTVG
jgi:hypothetical protein